MRVLVAKHDSGRAHALCAQLVGRGCQTTICPSAASCESCAMHDWFDVVAIDYELPDASAPDTCRRLRVAGVLTPILVFTPPEATTGRVACFEAGADDCVGESFELDELVARLHALARRNGQPPGRYLRVDDLVLDLRDHRCSRGGRQALLSEREFALLEFLMRQAGESVSRDRIAQEVWRMEKAPESNVIDVYVSLLRRKIEHEGRMRLLQTVKGVGYRLGGG